MFLIRDWNTNVLFSRKNPRSSAITLQVLPYRRAQIYVGIVFTYGHTKHMVCQASDIVCANCIGSFETISKKLQSLLFIPLLRPLVISPFVQPSVDIWFAYTLSLTLISACSFDRLQRTVSS